MVVVDRSIFLVEIIPRSVEAFNSGLAMKLATVLFHSYWFKAVDEWIRVSIVTTS